jgi:Ca-activated chloride channel family protein
MIRIEHPYYLVALVAIPIIVWLYYRYRKWKKKALAQFGDPVLVEGLIPGKSLLRQLLKLTLLLVALTLIIFSISNLQSGSAKQTVTHNGLDVAIVLDVSNSMLARDESPDRLEAARQFASQLINRLPDARIALVTFAGKPLLLTPLTIDHAAVQLLLNNASADNLPEQGTNLEAAINEGMAALPENQQHYRTVILLSDGENLEGTVNSAVQTAVESNVVICLAGFGSTAGASIPINENGIEIQKKDQEGKVVITRLAKEALEKIASGTHGIYVQPGNAPGEALSTLADYLEGIEGNEFDEEIMGQYESRFRWLLIPAMVILALELFISNRNSRKQYRIREKISHS